MIEASEEEGMDDMLNATIEMATQAVQTFDAQNDDTEPPTPFGPTPLPPHQPAEVEFVPTFF
jgi:hypothetical protein